MKRPPLSPPRVLERLLPQAFDEANGLRTVGRAHRDALGPTLRVLCWNILKARRPGFATDFRRLAADRDLVLLQESVMNTASDALFVEATAHQWTMARSFRDPRDRAEHGVKTGATAAPLEASYHVSPHAEPLVRTPKMLLVTRYALAPRAAADAHVEPSLLVLNMHAINFVSVAKYVSQLGQLVEALGEHDGPILLAGDFNTWSVRRRASFFAVAGEARLIEAPMERSARLGHLNSHLDHVFYRGLALRSISSLGQLDSSDHAPILATFEYGGTP